MRGAVPTIFGEAASFAAALLFSVFLDRFAVPRGTRDARGLALLASLLLVLFSAVLLLSASTSLASIVTIGLVAGVVFGSNSKHRLLGEPVCFSDAAVLAMVFRYPRFYVAGIPPPMRLVVCTMLALVVCLAATLSRSALIPRLIAAAGLAGALALACLALRRLFSTGAFVAPDLEGDVRRWGVLPTLAGYAARWCASSDPPPPPPLTLAEGAPEIVVLVQCESFADPALFVRSGRADGPVFLPCLDAARRRAFQHGALIVPGFGAYTMRTEYGVLSGRNEAALGFRRFDPYLTAAREAGHVLPRRLRPLDYGASFIHPFSLAFYDRVSLLPFFGFDRILGPDTFGIDAPRVGPYVADAAIADRILNEIERSNGRRLIYAVTMENHGPHDGRRLPDCRDGFAAWRQHLRHSDAMLGRVVDGLEADGRRALLVFFGDHRPSIPGRIEPRAGRNTSYVAMRFGGERGGGGQVDCTPAELNALVIGCCGRPAPA